MEFSSISNVYFLGIGGIGMSALARYFYEHGKNVAGYDLSPSQLTADLQQLGIEIHFTDDLGKIPQIFKDKANTLVIRTPAVPNNHKELNYFRDNNFTLKKRAEVLGILFNAKKGIAIAGTHGKTSVSSLLAHIMHNSSTGCSAFLGGIMKNTNSNLFIDEECDWLIAEADEFDRSFLQLHSEIALVTWVDEDHMDIYESAEDIKNTFAKFLSQVNAGGTIILKNDVALPVDTKKYELFTYSLNAEKSDFYAKNISIKNNRYEFDVVTPRGEVKNIRLSYPGQTNIENAVAAIAVATVVGIDKNEIANSLTGFLGVKRRFDIRHEGANCVYIDDYAHHPRELDAIIGSVKKLYPGKKITGVFQPHLFSRTRDFATGFALSLSALDELILLDIYPARELPLPGVDSNLIFNQVSIKNKCLCAKENLVDLLDSKEFEVLITMGAGDIDRYTSEIEKIAGSRTKK